MIRNICSIPHNLEDKSNFCPAVYKQPDSLLSKSRRFLPRITNSVSGNRPSILRDRDISAVQTKHPFSQISNYLEKLLSGQLDQATLDAIFASTFAEFCDRYYQRCNTLDHFLDKTSPRNDEAFCQILTHGPAHQTDVITYIKKYTERFQLKHLAPLKGTSLHKPSRFFHKGGCPPTCISMGKSYMKKTGHLRYEATEQYSASEIIKKIDHVFSAIGCAMAIDIAFYQTLLALLGERIFDRLFSEQELGCLVFDIKCQDTPLYSLLSGIGPDITEEKVPFPSPSFHPTPGIYYFCNHEDYSRKHPLGVGTGYNLVLVSSRFALHPMFTGFGLPGDGQTLDRIEQRLIDRFNCEAFRELSDSDMRIPPDKKQLMNQFAGRQITLEEFRQKDRLVKVPAYLDVNKVRKRVSLLVNSNDTSF